MVAAPQHCVGEHGQAVSPHPRHIGPGGEPAAQTGDRLLKRSLRHQGARAHDLWYHHKAKSLLGCERLGRSEQLQRQFRLTAI